MEWLLVDQPGDSVAGVLERTGGYWRDPEGSGGYWRVLEDTGGYWKVLGGRELGWGKENWPPNMHYYISAALFV